MNRRTKLVITGTMVASVAVAGGTGIAVASSDDGPGTSITGRALEHASRVALRETGGGRVTGSEVRDEESYYQVEVTKADGSQDDVQLDRSFTVVNATPDADRHRAG